MMYVRYPLPPRQVEDILFERGVDASNETVRHWLLKFGRLIANNLRQSRP